MIKTANSYGLHVYMWAFRSPLHPFHLLVHHRMEETRLNASLPQCANIQAYAVTNFDMPSTKLAATPPHPTHNTVLCVFLYSQTEPTHFILFIVRDTATVKIRLKMAARQESIHTDCNIQNTEICCLQKRFEITYVKP